jgi:hypothetical protein
LAFATLVTGVSARADAETVWLDVGLPGEAPAFHFEQLVKIGGTLQLEFEHRAKSYRVVLRAAERSASDKAATGLDGPLFEVLVYRGAVGPERLMAKAEADYPAGDKKTSCQIHVEPGLAEGFWITLGVGIGESPEDSCRQMMRITQEMKTKAP